MSSASRLNESTGTLTAPTRNWGSINSPSMTARSRIAAPCARISRSIASRSMAMRSDSARVSPAAAACDGNEPPASANASVRTPAKRLGVRNMHALRRVTARRRTSRWRSDDDGSAGYFRYRQKLTASEVLAAGAGVSALTKSAAAHAASATTKSTTSRWRRQQGSRKAHARINLRIMRERTHSRVDALFRLRRRAIRAVLTRRHHHAIRHGRRGQCRVDHRRCRHPRPGFERHHARGRRNLQPRQAERREHDP